MINRKRIAIKFLMVGLSSAAVVSTAHFLMKWTVSDRQIIGGWEDTLTLPLPLVIGCIWFLAMMAIALRGEL